MALRIHLKNGVVKDYKTWYESTDDGMSIYRTECKMKLPRWPEELDGCDHIECALKSSNWGKEEKKERSKAFAIVGMFWIVAALITLILKFDFWSAAMMMAAIAMIFALVDYYQYINEKDSKDYMELTEFKEHKTINGIEAKQI